MALKGDFGSAFVSANTQEPRRHEITTRNIIRRQGRRHGNADRRDVRQKITGTVRTDEMRTNQLKRPVRRPAQVAAQLRVRPLTSHTRTTV